ncbi:MAG: hypothetical protein RLZZ488_1740 [Pseudomonadota bacterium]|jgi:eight-cysteine-cluster-containing protein
MRLKYVLPIVVTTVFVAISACACKGPQQTQSPAVEPSSTQSAADAKQAFTGAGCARTGCSGHLCAPEGQSVVSTCMWREEYACYKTARCEKQSDGNCGWTPSAELTSCLDTARGMK